MIYRIYCGGMSRVTFDLSFYAPALIWPISVNPTHSLGPRGNITVLPCSRKHLLKVDDAIYYIYTRQAMHAY